MKRTNVFATEEEITEVLELHKEAQNTPVIALSLKQGLSGNDFASQAWGRLHDKIDDLAKEHGLPNTVGHYGFDGKNGEFLIT